MAGSGGSTILVLLFGSAGVYSFPSAATTNFFRLGGLKQQKCFLLFFFPEFRHQNVIMAVLPPNALGRSSSLLLLACSGYQMSLVPCFSLHKAIFPLFVTISRVASTYQNTSHWITAPPNPIRPLINNLITSAKTQFPN